ncbi:MAG: B12-binding domain-containing radical SAM protein [Candidatus Sericytochromatia bacterium]|nr:B12-binding domain-containing radical SAM protein [Candidatus Sericytochromatia bacterium]
MKSVTAKSGVKVRLAQISQQVGEGFYLPYSVGLLQAYAASKMPEHFQFLPPVYQRLPVSEALRTFSDVMIIGLSLYVWNTRRSLAWAEALKAEMPERLIIVGGPQVPDRAESFLRQHPFIDVCVHGPGEAVFLALLEAWPERKAEAWQQISGLSYLNAAGDFCHLPPAPRLADLTVYPSPYLNGVFDPLLSDPVRWHAILETNRGCPFSCTYCDWGSATASRVNRFDEARVLQEMEWIARQQIFDVFCADANFGMLKRDLHFAQQMALLRQRYQAPQAFQIQIAKNVGRRVLEIQKVLQASGMNTSSAISFQSLHAPVLKAIRRENISLEVYAELQQACRAHGIFAYTDLIMGLPEESYETFVQGVDQVMQHGQYLKIMFHDAALLPNAEMAQPAYRARYGIETTEVVIPFHRADETPELLEIVVAHQRLSRADWRRMHVFAWLCLFLFYTDKLLQQVLIVLQHWLKCSYRELIELFSEGDLTGFPLLAELRRLLQQTASQQQKGYPESELDSLILNPVQGTHLTPDVTLQIMLCREGQLDVFYAEAGRLLAGFARQRDPAFPLELLEDVLASNRQLFLHFYQARQLPLHPALPLNPQLPPPRYHLKAFFEALMQGQPLEIVPYANPGKLA